MESRRDLRNSNRQRTRREKPRNSWVRNAVFAGALFGSTIMGCAGTQRPEARTSQNVVPKKVETTVSVEKTDVCEEPQQSKRPFGVSHESEEFMGVKKGSVIRYLGQVQEIDDDGVLFCSGLRLSNDSNKAVGEFQEVYVRRGQSEADGVDIVLTKSTFHITSKNGRASKPSNRWERAEELRCEKLPESKKPLAVLHVTDEYIDVEEGTTIPGLGTVEKIKRRGGVRFCSGLNLSYGVTEAVGDLSRVKIEREKLKAVKITATKSRFSINAPTEKAEVSDGDVVIVTYIKEKKTVSKGDYLFKKVSLEGEGFFGMKVRKVDAKGIEVDFEMEMFMSKHKGPPWRINYGEKKTIGEFILKVTVKPEKRTGPNTAVVEITAPEAYTEEKRTTKGRMKRPGKLPYREVE